MAYGEAGSPWMGGLPYIVLILAHEVLMCMRYDENFLTLLPFKKFIMNVLTTIPIGFAFVVQAFIYKNIITYLVMCYPSVLKIPYILFLCALPFVYSLPLFQPLRLKLWVKKCTVYSFLGRNALCEIKEMIYETDSNHKVEVGISQAHAVCSKRCSNSGIVN